MAPPKSKFSATASATGYLYQFRVALLWSLKKLPNGSDFQVAVETLDDISFTSSKGNALELLQTKHQINRKANLTDTSPDLWKTLRVWLDAYKNKSISKNTILYLITTGKVKKGHAAGYLQSKNRDIAAADDRLLSAAKSSASDSNSEAYKLFLKTPKSDRQIILGNVIVIDSAKDIKNIEDSIKEALFSATERKHLDAFVRRLEGWWLQRVLRQLITPSREISAIEIETEMGDLRNQFKQESLPIDDDLLNYTLDETTKDKHEKSIFVQQVELTKASKARVMAAIRDYYRAFEQRSRWIREDLSCIGEINAFEKALIEEWEIAFAEMRDRCGEHATDTEKERYARELLHWAEQIAPSQISIRPLVTTPFVTRGSLHMLADDCRVGWHPNFSNRLCALLQVLAEQND